MHPGAHCSRSAFFQGRFVFVRPCDTKDEWRKGTMVNGTQVKCKHCGAAIAFKHDPNHSNPVTLIGCHCDNRTDYVMPDGFMYGAAGGIWTLYVPAGTNTTV